jgi:nucleoside-diphosphate-sugar epimerase
MPRILDDQGARTEWNWSLRYSLEDMVADFVKELGRTP